MKAKKQTAEILDYVLSCFREKFGNCIVGGDVKFLPDEAFVEVSVREKKDKKKNMTENEIAKIIVDAAGYDFCEGMIRFAKDGQPKPGGQVYV